jgi:hypothetical protein
MKVQNQKTIMAQDRTVVQSRGERDIANWLSHQGIAYHYDDKFQIIQGYAVRPDFYLPRFDVYTISRERSGPDCIRRRLSTEDHSRADQVIAILV